MADSRKEREKVLADYRTKANEKKEFAEKVERRVSYKMTTASEYWEIMFSYSWDVHRYYTLLAQAVSYTG